MNVKLSLPIMHISDGTVCFSTIIMYSRYNLSIQIDTFRYCRFP